MYTIPELHNKWCLKSVDTIKEQKQEHVVLGLEQKMKVCKRSDLVFLKVFLMRTADSCIQNIMIPTPAG
jgi:hypothetical protein